MYQTDFYTYSYFHVLKSINERPHGTRTQPLICVGRSVYYWVSCAINKGGFFEIGFVVDTHFPRFEALANVLPHFDALTHVVIRASSAFIFQTFAEVCYSVFVNRSSFKSVLNLRKAYIFKSLLKVYYRSVVQTLTTKDCKEPQTNMPKNVGSIKTWSAKIIM